MLSARRSTITATVVIVLSLCAALIYLLKQFRSSRYVRTDLKLSRGIFTAKVRSPRGMLHAGIKRDAGDDAVCHTYRKQATVRSRRALNHSRAAAFGKPSMIKIAKLRL